MTFSSIRVIFINYDYFDIYATFCVYFWDCLTLKFWLWRKADVNLFTRQICLELEENMLSWCEMLQPASIDFISHKEGKSLDTASWTQPFFESVKKEFISSH